MARNPPSPGSPRFCKLAAYGRFRFSIFQCHLKKTTQSELGAIVWSILENQVKLETADRVLADETTVDIAADLTVTDHTPLHEWIPARHPCDEEGLPARPVID